jgi:hypothetical protein
MSFLSAAKLWNLSLFTLSEFNEEQNDMFVRAVIIAPRMLSQ